MAGNNECSSLHVASFACFLISFDQSLRTNFNWYRPQNRSKYHMWEAGRSPKVRWPGQSHVPMVCRSHVGYWLMMSETEHSEGVFCMCVLCSCKEKLQSSKTDHDLQSLNLQRFFSSTGTIWYTWGTCARIIMQDAIWRSALFVFLGELGCIKLPTSYLCI